MATTPPTQAEVQMIGLLNDIRNQLQKMGKSSSSSAGSQEASDERKRNKSARDLNDNLKTLERNTNKLNKRIVEAEKEFAKGVKIFNRSLLDVIKDTFIPARKIVKDTMQDFKQSMDDIVDNQKLEFRELAKGTREYLKTNKLATTNIKAAIGAHRDYTNIINRLSKTQDKISEAEADKLRYFEKVMQDFSEQLTGDKRTLVKMDMEQAAAFKKLQKGFKLTTEELNKIVPVLQSVEKNLGVISETTEAYSSALTKGVKELKSAMLDAVKGFVTNIKAAVVAAAPQVYKDIMAQAQNAVRQSDYTGAARLGVSEATLAEFVGQNRLALRTMGGGRANAPIENGQVNQMQNMAHMLGLTGADALKFVGKQLNNMVDTGIRPSVENFKKQTDVLYQTMQKTGLSFEQINALMDDLAKSPAFLQLAQAQGFEGQAETVAVLTKSLTEQGYSADYLKELLDLTKQNQYRGIADAVKAMVGTRLLSGQINRSLGRQEITGQDQNLLDILNQRGGLAGAAATYKSGNLDQGIYQQYGTVQDFEKALTDAQLKINKGGVAANLSATTSQNAYAGLVQKTLLGTFGQMAGPEFQQYDAATAANARQNARFGTTNPTGQQTNLLLGGAPGELVKSMDEIRNAFLPLGDATVRFTAALKEATNFMEENPLGRASSSLLSAIKELTSTILIMKGLGTLKGFMPGAGGGILGKLGGIGKGALGAGGRMLGGLGGMLGAEAGTAAAGGLAGTLGLAGAAGVAGYGVGTWANNKFGISDWLNDSMLKEREEAAMGQMFFPAHPKPNSGLKKPEDLVDKPAMPNGDTVGDLMTNNNDRLGELVDLQKQTLDLTQKQHQEYMDYMSGQDVSDRINSARNTVRRVMTGDAT
jgi:ElaB/YqjD/DUF883 family membrane-anchored ribosome-binding protein